MYRVAPRAHEAIENQVEAMLQNDVIQPSKTPWASPVLLYEKKDGSLRFCVQYRKHNQATKKDVCPLLRIDDFPTSSDKKAVRRILGACAYYRRFIHIFLHIVSLLTRLKRDDATFILGEEQ